MKEGFYIANRQLEIFKMLANANRIKILKAVILCEGGGMNVGSISHATNIPQSLVSDHLKLLSLNNILRARQLGTEMHYSLREPAIPRLLAIAP